MRMSQEFLDFMIGYYWPGNVRELQNLVERMVILADGNILRVTDLPESIRFAGFGPVSAEAVGESEVAPDLFQNQTYRELSPRSLEEIEKQEVEKALRRHGWVQARAARELGLTQRQIGYKVKKYGLSRPAF